jgi:hypothetical protein
MKYKSDKLGPILRNLCAIQPKIKDTRLSIYPSLVKLGTSDGKKLSGNILSCLFRIAHLNRLANEHRNVHNPFLM